MSAAIVALAEGASITPLSLRRLNDAAAHLVALQ
jgi:hypothetical protein